MAEGWARRLLGATYEVHSAGTHPSQVNPLAIRVMAEVGIDLSGHRSKGLDAVPAEPEIVVTLCDHAAGRCPAFPARVRIEPWGLPDPAEATGTPAEVLITYRAVRDEIERRLRERLDHWPV